MTKNVHYESKLVRKWYMRICLEREPHVLMYFKFSICQHNIHIDVHRKCMKLWMKMKGSDHVDVKATNFLNHIYAYSAIIRILPELHLGHGTGLFWNCKEQVTCKSLLVSQSAFIYKNHVYIEEGPNIHTKKCMLIFQPTSKIHTWTLTWKPNQTDTIYPQLKVKCNCNMNGRSSWGRSPSFDQVEFTKTLDYLVLNLYHLDNWLACL